MWMKGELERVGRESKEWFKIVSSVGEHWVVLLASCMGIHLLGRPGC